MKGINSKYLMVVLVLLILPAFLTGCFRKPYPKPLMVEADPNSTLIVVSQEGDTLEKQGQLDSLEYLKAKKVPSKRVELEQRWLKKGRPYLFLFDTNGEWIPSDKAIIVDRTPVNLEWTADKDRGSSSKNEGIIGEDMNSISFAIDWYVTATIIEEDAYKYLYWYGIDQNTSLKKGDWTYVVKARDLRSVVDTEVKRMVAELFTTEVGTRGLRDITTQDGIREGIINGKRSITASIKATITEYFKTKGITITATGWTGDITYFDQTVQDSINSEFIEDRKMAAQVKENERLLGIATNRVDIATQDRLAAEELDKAWDIIYKQRLLDIEEKRLDIVEKHWDGDVPNTFLGGDYGKMEFILPSNSSPTQ